MKKIALTENKHYQKLWHPYKELMSIPLEKMAYLALFEKDEKLVRAGSDMPELYILLTGKAKIYLIHEDGKQSIIHFIQPGEMIGELGLLKVEERTKEIVAQKESLCLVIPMKAYKDILLNDVTFLQSLAKYLGDKVLNRTERYSKEMNYPVINRLATFILQTEHEGVYSEKHTEVAEYLNVSYRHLLYAFEQLIAQGMLEKKKPKFMIKDKQKLQDLSIEAIHQMNTELVDRSDETDVMTK